MQKMELWERWKKVAMYIAVAMVAMFVMLKAVPAYAGDFTTAITLPTNGTWGGKCELATETTDYYKFTISTAGEIDIKLMSYSSGLHCNLYDSNFNKIRDILGLSGSETSPNTESIIQWLSQGTYYVSITHGVGKGGIYRLYASFSSSGITAADKDSYDSTQNISINSKATGVITYSNNEDWYKVKVSSAGKYKQICQYINKMECTLYDMNLSQVNKMYCSSSNTETEEIELDPGIYYIKIGIRYGGTYSYQLEEIIAAKGDILTDAKNQVQYKVTKPGKSGGTVTYLKSTNGVKSSITIPATVKIDNITYKIDNITYKVTGIASNAFKGNGMLKKVTIGKNVASIGKKAFYNCRNLKSVTIKTTKLTSSKVGASAFKCINKKAAIKVPKKKFKVYKSILKKKGADKGVTYKKL